MEKNMKKFLMVFVFLFVGLTQLIYAKELSFYVTNRTDVAFQIRGFETCPSILDDHCRHVCDGVSMNISKDWKKLRKYEPMQFVIPDISDKCFEILLKQPLRFRDGEDELKKVDCMLKPINATYKIISSADGKNIECVED
jgi:hypothetical protein